MVDADNDPVCLSTATPCCGRSWLFVLLLAFCFDFFALSNYYYIFFMLLRPVATNSVSCWCFYKEGNLQLGKGDENSLTNDFYFNVIVM